LHFVVPLLLLLLQAFSAVSIMEIASAKATGAHTQQQGTPAHCNSRLGAIQCHSAKPTGGCGFAAADSNLLLSVQSSCIDDMYARPAVNHTYDAAC
jgi:hypothetical protein